MADARRRLTAIFSAQDRMSRVMDNLGNSTSRTSRTFKKLSLVGKASMAGIAAVVGKTLKDSVDAYIKFDKGMSEVFTLLPGKSQEAYDELASQTKALAAEMGILPEQAVPALYQALSAGVPEDNVFNFLEVAQKAAVGGITDLETAVDGITGVTNSYGQGLYSAAAASDLMFTTVKLGKTTFDELSNSLYNVIPAAASFGVSFEDVSAAMSTITSQSVPTSVATTQLRSVINELGKAGSKASKTFQSLSGKTFKDFINSGGNLQDALQLMEKGANDSNLSIGDLFSSVEAGNAALALTGKHTEKFTNDLEAMNNASGATEEAFATMEKSLGRSFERIKASFQVVLINIGEALAPAVRVVADGLEKIIPIIGSGLEKIKTFASDVGAAFGMVFGKKQVKGINDITAGQAKMGSMFIDLKKKLDPFIEAIGPALQAHLKGFISMMNRVGKVFKSVAGKIGSLIVTVFQFFTDHIMPRMQSVIEEVMPYVSNIIYETYNIISTAFERVGFLIGFVVDMFKTMWPVIGTVILTVWDIMQPILVNIMKAFSGLIKFISGVFTMDWSKAWQGVVDIFGAIFSTLGELVKAPLNGVIFLINKAIDAINLIQIDVPDEVPIIGGQHYGFDVKKIPMLAKGTEDWIGGPAIVGEAGPELITTPTYADLPKGTSVTPIDKLGGDNDNRQYNIYLDSKQVSSEDDPQSFKDKVLEVLDQIITDEDDGGGGIVFG